MDELKEPHRNGRFEHRSGRKTHRSGGFEHPKIEKII
jgi:hypothetical protein